MDKLILLPVYVQVMVGCGYLGYLMARQGFRRNEQAADQVLGAVVFGLPALPAWFVVLDMTGSVVASGVAAALLCVAFALLWRVWLVDAWLAFSHSRQISNEDGKGNIWDTLTQDTEIYPTQIVVYLKNGGRVRCHSTYDLQDTAIKAPVLFDAAGNVALFVTDEWQDGMWVAADDVFHAWGDRLTYIPVAEIIRTDIRYTRTNQSRA